MIDLSNDRSDLRSESEQGVGVDHARTDSKAPQLYTVVSQHNLNKYSTLQIESYYEGGADGNNDIRGEREALMVQPNFGKKSEDDTGN